jgi:hypothetical protein
MVSVYYPAKWGGIRADWNHHPIKKTAPLARGSSVILTTFNTYENLWFKG